MASIGPDDRHVRISPDTGNDVVPPAEQWALDSEPSLGRPVRTVLTEKGKPTKVEWRFKVALGGKDHTGWVDGKNVRDTRELTVTFDISKGDLSKPKLEQETAIATIKELQGKFARMDPSEAEELFDALKDNIQQIEILRVKQDEKGPVLGICVVWRDSENQLFALYHDHNTHKVYKKEFDKGATISSVERDVIEMFAEGKDVEGRSWVQWMRGKPTPAGEIAFRFNKTRHKGKHERLKDQPGYDKVKGHSSDTVQDRLSRMPFENAKDREIAADAAARTTAVRDAALGAGKRKARSDSDASDASTDSH